MKRALLMRHLREERCIFVREGGKHSVFFNPSTGRSSTVPRHNENEIDDFLVKKICRDLGVANPKKK